MPKPSIFGSPITSNRNSWKLLVKGKPVITMPENVHRLLQIGIVGNLTDKVAAKTKILAAVFTDYFKSE